MTKKLHKSAILLNLRALNSELKKIDKFIDSFRDSTVDVDFLNKKNKVVTKTLPKEAAREGLKFLSRLWHKHGGNNFTQRKYNAKANIFETIKTFVSEEDYKRKTFGQYVLQWQGRTYVKYLLDLVIPEAKAEDLNSNYKLFNKLYGSKSTAGIKIQGYGNFNVSSSYEDEEYSGSFVFTKNFAAKAYIFNKNIDLASLGYMNVTTCEIDEENPNGIATQTSLLGYSVSGEGELLINDSSLEDLALGNEPPFLTDQCVFSLEDARERQVSRDASGDDRAKGKRKVWEKKSFCIPYIELTLTRVSR